MAIAIELDWARDPKGYRLVEAGQPKILRIVRKGTGHGPKHLVPCYPLNSTDLLFKIFAHVATTPEGALDFVNRFGPLTPEGWDRGGDQVSLVTFHAEYMREILRARAGKNKKPRIAFRSQRSGPGRPLVVDAHDTGPSVSLNAKLVWDPVTKALNWKFHPTTLLDALWLQLGQALTAGTQIRQCEHCGDWFEAGRGTERRLDAKFCSDEHRIAFNSLKRSREI